MESPIRARGPGGALTPLGGQGALDRLVAAGRVAQPRQVGRLPVQPLAANFPVGGEGRRARACASLGPEIASVVSGEASPAVAVALDLEGLNAGLFTA